MRINTNILSLSTQNRIAQTQKILARAMQRLSSGKRINSARDDAAGLAIATGLEAKTRGYAQAALNINASFGMLATAENAMASMIEMVQRMRELSVQAANGTLSNKDRTNLDAEFQQLLAEYQRVTNQTDFNGRKLIDGSFTTTTLQVGANADQQISFNIGNLQSNAIFLKAVNNGDFSSRTTTTVGTSPSSLKVADIDNDGNQDLVVLDSSGLGYYAGNGDGSFESRKTISTTAVSNFEIGDFNADGRIDLVANQGTTIYTFQNQGSGTFVASSTTVSDTIKAIAVGDIDGDGQADFAVDYINSSTNQTDLQAFFSSATGTFSRATTSSLGTALVGNNIFLGDTNGDKKAELAYLSSTSFILRSGAGTGVYVSAGQQSLSMGASYNASSGAFSDITGDGKADFVGYATRVGVGGEIRAFVNNGTGTLTAAATKQAGSTTSPGGGALAMGDINNDGKNDAIVTLAGENVLATFISNGDGTFATQKTYATGTTPRTPALADFNGDGVLDIANADSAGSVISIVNGKSSQTSALTDMTIATQSQAKALLTILDQAIDSLVAQRANLGAIQNRLDFAYNTTQITKENLLKARSQIMDADITTEASEFLRNQILQQAQVSVQAQANSQLQLVLNLLKF